MSEAFQLGESKPVSELRESLRRERLDADHQERDERMAVLQAHNAKWTAIQKALHERCEALGGHVWRDLPDNGFNRPHFITGKWPQRCRICNLKSYS
jgi:hypothetical protein